MKFNPKTHRVALLAGGWSGERGISLRSGQGVAAEAKRLGWKLRAYDLVPDGPLRVVPQASPAWALRCTLSQLLPRLKRDRVDIVLLCLHGAFGEDGRLQGLLEMAGLPYSGSSALASTLAMNKHLAKQVFVDAGLPVAEGAVARRGERAPALAPPLVVKPSDAGSALGVSIVRRPAAYARALKAAFRHGSVAVVERYIAGREFTVGVLGASALPVIEILPRKGAFYDFKSKYSAGGSEHICPAALPARQAARAQALALAAHQALGCRAYSRCDLMLDAKGHWHILEVNTLPGMTSVSLFPEAAKAAGYSYGELLQAMLSLSWTAK